MTPPAHACISAERIDGIDLEVRQMSTQMVRIEEWFARNDDQHNTIAERLDGISAKLSGDGGLVVKVARHGVMLAVGAALLLLVGGGLVTILARVMSR